MREHMIGSAMDQNLSGLYMTKEMKMNVLYRVQNDKAAAPKTFRLSFGLIAAIVSILVTVGAVAAVLLGGKAFTKDVVAPIAMQTDSERFSAQEVKEILRLADENGIPVPQYLRERWEKWGGEYKEELMRALVKTELGFYPGSWSLEDQNWYSQMLVECGLADGVGNLLPGENDFTQEQVLHMANTLMVEKLELPPDYADETKFQRFFTFGMDTNNPNVTFKRWDVGYEDLETGAQYNFVMLDNGLITQAWRYQPGTEASLHALTEDDVVNSFRHYFGNSVLQWNMEVLEQFYHSFAMCDHTKKTADPGIRIVAQTCFLLPGGYYTYMTEEEAIRLAREACKADESLQPYVIYFGDGPNNMHWKISFWEGTEKNKQFRFYAQIDGRTGETEYAGDYSGAPWYAPLVSADLHASIAEDKTPRIYEKPENWRSPIFTDDYWDALEALDYNAETREQRIAEWDNQYGNATNQWPYAHQAVFWWWDMNPEFQNINCHVPGIPVEGEHISKEEAEKIARNCFMEEAPSLFTEEELSRMNILPPDFHYQVDNGQIVAHVWRFDIQIQFDDGQYSDSLIHIDAHTGEILEKDISSAPGNG